MDRRIGSPDPYLRLQYPKGSCGVKRLLPSDLPVLCSGVAFRQIGQG